MDVTFWSNLLLPGVSIGEKILRPILVYVFLVVGLRLAGKRELAQLNPFDLVVLLTLSNTVQNAIIGNDNSVAGGLIGASTLLIVNALVVRWTYRHPAMERLVEGSAVALIEDGVVRSDRLEKELVTLDELTTAAHRHGLVSLDDVDRAVLDPGGTLSFSPKRETTQVRRHDELVARLQAMQELLEGVRRDMAIGPAAPR